MEIPQEYNLSLTRDLSHGSGQRYDVEPLKEPVVVDPAIRARRCKKFLESLMLSMKPES